LVSDSQPPLKNEEVVSSTETFFERGYSLLQVGYT